jgi:hypothetical protein
MYLADEYHWMSSFDIVCDPTCVITLIENFPCDDVNELRKRERYFIEITPNHCNKVLPTRTDKEYREDNKDKIQQWRDDNKLILAEKRKVYKELNKDKIREYYNSHKDEQKEYRKLNKDKAKERAARSYENNKDKIKLRNSQMINCDTCKCDIQKAQFSRHVKTKKHLSNLLPDA